MVVFEVIGRRLVRRVRAFMIAAGQKWVDVSGSNSRLRPLRLRRDRPGMADREERRWIYTQRNSVSFSHKEWSKTASLRATAILARLLPFASTIRCPHC